MFFKIQIKNLVFEFNFEILFTALNVLINVGPARLSNF